MKIKLLVGLFLFAAAVQESKAQHVRMRMQFPSGVTVIAPGPAPFRGAVWIGPEWQWRGGRYVHVPGYWSKPHPRHSRWAPGRWKHGRRGYVWAPGRWR